MSVQHINTVQSTSSKPVLLQDHLSFGTPFQDASSSTLQYWCSPPTPAPCTQSPLGTSGSCHNPEMHKPDREMGYLGSQEGRQHGHRAAGSRRWYCWRRSCREAALASGQTGNSGSCFRNLCSFCIVSQDLEEFANSLHKVHASLLGFRVKN